MSAKKGHKKVNRRKFLADTARTACGVGLFGLAVGFYSKTANSLPATAIRPPGARPEKEFLSACVRCGQCVRDCPYQILKLAEFGRDDAATGTPFFTARTGPCEMCEDIPCVPACPTGALDHALTDINKARMGLAVLIDEETCIAFQGLRCEVCYNVCPLRKKALYLDRRPNTRTGMHAIFVPVVSSDACTGCGLCEHACIVEEAAIKVLPLRLAKGEIGKHYRLGWKEKNARGKALVTPDTEHHFNLPDDMEYDYYGKGLIKKGSKTAPQAGRSPFSSNPLDTLNKGLKETN
ncbi:MAG TPA: ferredoxin-type protein NapG [Rhizobiales bacterium]|nr:ferredoxin-type protein NapG [Hyphomicrobiales bacterium]